jgi:hypothetical protein
MLLELFLLLLAFLFSLSLPASVLLLAFLLLLAPVRYGASVVISVPTFALLASCYLAVKSVVVLHALQP